MNTIISKVRNLINDNYKFISETQEYYGGSKLFPLQYDTLDESTLLIYKNGVIWASSNYTYLNGKVTVTGTLVAGDNLTFEYNAFEKYSDTEIRGYICSALYYLSIEQYGTFTIESGETISPTPTEAEENLIAIVASILIKGNIRQYRTPEFTIIFDTDNMSIDKKIRTILRQFRKAYGVLDYLNLDYISW